MKSDRYVVIQGWMCNELKLKGNDLLVFALIHGFSQDEESRFSGSRKYIAETFNISLPTVDKAIKNLIEKELVEQHKMIVNGVVFYEYNSLPGIKKLYRGGKETLPNKDSNKQIVKVKNNNSIINNTIVESGKFLGSANKKPKDTLYSKVSSSISNFTQDSQLKNALYDFFHLQLDIYKEQNKTYYFNIWKSRLNKLEKDFDKEEWLEIVTHATEKGWQNFYPINDSYTPKEKPWEKGVRSDKQTKEEKEEMERWQEEMRQKGVRVDF